MTGPSFHEGFHLVPILIIGVVMSGQNVIYGGVLASEKRTKIQGGISVVGAVFSFIFNLVLIPMWGTVAAALSRMFSYVIMNTALFVKMTFPGKTIHKETLAVLIILIIPHVMFWLFPEISILGFILKSVVAVLYILFLMKLFGVSVMDLKVMFLKK